MRAGCHSCTATRANYLCGGLDMESVWIHSYLLMNVTASFSELIPSCFKIEMLVKLDCTLSDGIFNIGNGLQLNDMACN